MTRFDALNNGCDVAADVIASYCQYSTNNCGACGSECWGEGELLGVGFLTERLGAVQE